MTRARGLLQTLARVFGKSKNERRQAEKSDKENMKHEHKLKKSQGQDVAWAS